MTADVSVVIPTHNRRWLLSMALRSALQQDGVSVEVIVVDEGSTDDTPSVLAALSDPRVRVVRHDSPRGVSCARNRGAADGSGEWLAFLDDDDLWAPDKLARQLQAARAAGRDWAYAGCVNISGRCRIIHGRQPLPPDGVMAALPRYNAIPGGGSNVVVRRAAWLRAGPFDLRLRNTEDWDMWIRLAKEGPPAWVCKPLIGYRIHTSNSSLNVAEIIRGARLIAAKHDAAVDWGRLHRWLGQSCLRSGHRLAALHHFARAAARGDAFPAASDLTALVRHAVARRLGWLAGGGLPSVNPWIESADTWLRVFREEPDHGYRSTPER